MRLQDLPAVLTCFAYGEHYLPEVEGMLATIREHHPRWPRVIGRGPVAGRGMPTLEVELPSGRQHWSLPVDLRLDGTQEDWRRITRMKAWWVAQVWNQRGLLPEAERQRLVWVDADARLNGPLDIELDPEAEVVAGPWWDDPENPAHDTICSGILVLQGAGQGTVSRIVEEWSDRCVQEIRTLPPRTMPWFDGDQEVLNEVLRSREKQGDPCVLVKLEHDRYAGIVSKDGTPVPGALVDQWQMGRKMKSPLGRELNWPPPEAARRPLRNPR